MKVGGSANARLVGGSIVIARNRKPRSLMDGTQDIGIGIGTRTVDWDIDIDFDTKTEYDRFKAGTNDSLELTWSTAAVTLGTTSHPSLDVKLGTTFYETGAIDDSKDLPTVSAKGTALYTSGDASSIVAVLRAMKNFATI